jgi:hypothetical protein
VATLSGHHSRTIFSVDWSASGFIASGGADNAIVIFKGAVEAPGADIDPLRRPAYELVRK